MGKGSSIFYLSISSTGKIFGSLFTHSAFKALEFVEQWVGASYPFSSLKIVFSGTSSVPVISGATLVVVNIQLLVSQRDLDHVWFSRFYLCAAIAHQWFAHYISKESM